MRKKINYGVGVRKPLVKNLLLIEGISRAGKFLLANLVGGFADIEPVQYYGLLEHISFLEKQKLMNRKMARELLKCEIDTHCYEVLIGRNINYRLTDKSSVFNNPRQREFIDRSKVENIKQLLDYHKKVNPFSLFIMHELMPNIDIYFETFPHLKVLSLMRSPVELVYSWYKRGLTGRLGTDPILFIIPLRDQKYQFPWYVAGQHKKYLALKEMDRAIVAILELFNLYKKAIAELSPAQRKKILFIRYEDILLRTDYVIKKVSNFLKKPILPEMKSVIAREKIPNPIYKIEDQAKLQEIKKLASSNLFEQLLKMQKEYLKNT